jgi:hypothetical protein
MGYLNPLFDLPSAKALLERPLEERLALAAIFRDLRAQANVEAEKSWAKRKGPMAAYWRAVSTYARHTAHALGQSTPAAIAAQDNPIPEPTTCLHAGNLAAEVFQ